MTHVRLAAAVDERAGGKNFKGMGSTWSDVELSFEYWAKRIKTKLTELRAQ